MRSRQIRFNLSVGDVSSIDGNSEDGSKVAVADGTIRSATLDGPWLSSGLPPEEGSPLLTVKSTTLSSEWALWTDVPGKEAKLTSPHKFSLGIEYAKGLR